MEPWGKAATPREEVREGRSFNLGEFCHGCVRNRFGLVNETRPAHRPSGGSSCVLGDTLECAANGRPFVLKWRLDLCIRELLQRQKGPLVAN